MDPLERRYRAHFYQDLDMGMIPQLFEDFKGPKDYRAFANLVHIKEADMGIAKLDTIRTIHNIEMTDEGHGDYRFDFFLDGALYRMVRNIVGAFVSVSSGQVSADYVKS
eukprot:CAMPEP_0113946458 /NCGR_PEP_ID=MMETSP1339-20121228/57613_1 /TAXON_ID=94617 /ORGANISM="Fibrocapsa japonica" /LENGTH=108 /DNA_ID=CAMNT_0000952545 /DNA_START=31 /DNA_END=355 /DNA_ORIENTATION=- /assembly_acc=CAM_ASM_000762